MECEWAGVAVQGGVSVCGRGSSRLGVAGRRRIPRVRALARALVPKVLYAVFGTFGSGTFFCVRLGHARSRALVPLLLTLTVTPRTKTPRSPKPNEATWIVVVELPGKPQAIAFATPRPCSPKHNIFQQYTAVYDLQLYPQTEDRPQTRRPRPIRDRQATPEIG